MSSVLRREPRPEMPSKLYSYILSIEENIKKTDPDYFTNDPSDYRYLPPDADKTMKAMLNDYRFIIDKWHRTNTMLRNPHAYAKLTEFRKTASPKKGGKRKLNKRTRRTARK